MATNNKKAGGAWKETRHDKFYHLAKEQGYRSRAAFKLIQLNKKYNFLADCKSLVDLGAAPGGWLQVAQKYMPVSSLIVGLDLLPIRPIRGVTTLQNDLTTEQAKKAIKQELQTWDVDVVLHDGAPNVAGGQSWTRDAYVQNELVVHSLRLATTVLRQGGWFVTKIFRSQDYNSLLWVLQQFFKKVEVTKPAASRNASAEIFAVCQGYLAPKKIDAKLLDPAQIFQSFDEEAATRKPDVFSSKQPKRNRSGYADVANMTQTRKLDILRFVSRSTDQQEAIRMLGDYTEFTFEPAPTEAKESQSKDLTVVPLSPEERAAHDALLQVVLSHAATTDEVRDLCRDLRVLGKGDFKSLLKYRKAIQTYLAQLEEEEKKKDGRWEAEEAERKAREEARAAEEAAKPQLSEQEQFELELAELRAKKALDKLRERKKKREMRAKANKRALVNLHNMKEAGELIGNDSSAQGNQDGLFSLGTIKNRDSLDYVAETEGAGKLARDAEDGEDSAEDSDEGELYRELLQQSELEYELARKRRGANALLGDDAPLNQYEDEEQQLLQKIRARDAKRTRNWSGPESIGIGNVRGDEDAEDYHAKLERDLDYMYAQYTERRAITTKKRQGASALNLDDEVEGQKLLEQAREEERRKRAKQSRKRKREAGDSDTDDSDDDMDRFNSSSSDSEDPSSSDDDEGEEEQIPSARALQDSSDEEENSNPLLRKLEAETKPSTAARMSRWFQRGLLGEVAAEAEAGSGEEEEEEEEEAQAKPVKKTKGKQKKERKLIDIDAGAASSSDDDGAAHSDAEMAPSSEDDAEARGSSFFSAGQRVATKSGLKPNTVLGLDGLKRTTKDVHDDVVMQDAEKEEGKGKKGKKGKKALKPAAPLLDEDGDVVDTLKQAEKDARARLKKTTKNYKAQEKARSELEKEKAEAFEEVPLQHSDDEELVLSSDDDAVAERLALGRKMLHKKSRDALLNDSYSRYSLDAEELAGLPEWFLRDEGQHHAPILPVTKQEVDSYKEQLKAINARPIRKIAEAKARKQVKTQKRWEKIKAQAELIANQEGGNQGDKLRQIEKLFRQKTLKKEKKERVYVVTLKNGKTVTPKSSGGRKGKVVKVDARMKKDKKGEQRAEKRNRKKEATRNKKKRKL